MGSADAAFTEPAVVAKAHLACLVDRVLAHAELGRGLGWRACAAPKSTNVDNRFADWTFRVYGRVVPQDRRDEEAGGTRRRGDRLAVWGRGSKRDDGTRRQACCLASAGDRLTDAGAGMRQMTMDPSEWRRRSRRSVGTAVPPPRRPGAAPAAVVAIRLEGQPASSAASRIAEAVFSPRRRR